VGELVRIYSTSRLPEGQLLQARLEDEGIPVMLKGDEGPYRMGPVDIYVPTEYEIQAKLVLDAIARGEYAADLSDQPEG
jgi:hypothetical protein